MMTGKNPEPSAANTTLTSDLGLPEQLCSLFTFFLLYRYGSLGGDRGV